MQGAGPKLGYSEYGLPREYPRTRAVFRAAESQRVARAEHPHGGI